MLTCSHEWSPKCPPWPAPDWYRRFSSIPVLGTLVSITIGRMLLDNYRLNYFFKVEEEIFDQVRRRDRSVWAAVSAEELEVLDALAAAIAVEKNIADPTIELDDEVRWLLWGAFDDLTPAQFLIELKRKGYRLESRELAPVFEHPLTVRDLLVRVAARAKRQ